MSDLLYALGYLFLAASAAAPAYLGLLAVGSVFPRKSAIPKLSTPKTKFAVIVPAHNEEIMIADTLLSLARQDYPHALFAIHVIADNCTDSTAAIARGLGATVHERMAPDAPGKGQALQWLLNDLQLRNDLDAFVFVDADTVIDANFLRAADLRLQEGQNLLQASYRVLGATSHPLVGLRALAFALFHDLRGRGKSFFRLSAGLWGNGMVMSHQVLIQVPWQGFTAIEDAEQHLKFLLKGERVSFMGETHVYGHMPFSLGAARAQQTRWEGGRLALARRYGPSLLAAAFKHRSPAIAAAFFELAIPPLSVLVVQVFIAAAISFWIAQPLAYLLGLISLLGVAIYVASGFVAAHLPVRTYASLLYAPVYITWKLWLFLEQLRVRRDPAWTRTSRKG